MAILSKRIMADVGRAYYEKTSLRPRFMNLAGQITAGRDDFGALPTTRRRRDYALQESINRGEAYVFTPVEGILTWVVALEDRRMVHGGLIGGEVRVDENGSEEDVLHALIQGGILPEHATAVAHRLPCWTESQIREAAELLHRTFYDISGWRPVLMEENRLRNLQQNQINQAIADQRQRGESALYAFEKERELLAHIRAGDRNGARRILNEMLATIYLSSPQLVVLRVRAVELISCLTRAAIEDNPLMEPLIERNHLWTERLIRAKDFEHLSAELMDALDEFIEGIYLHGMNRLNMKVRRALDFISANYMKRISLRTVAAEVGLSSCRLSHLVKELTGRTVLEIIQQVRVRQAQHLLERTSRSCADIAYEVGFGDQSYFTKHFRRLTGTTPARYRRAGSSERSGTTLS